MRLHFERASIIDGFWMILSILCYSRSYVFRVAASRDG